MRIGCLKSFVGKCRYALVCNHVIESRLSNEICNDWRLFFCLSFSFFHTVCSSGLVFECVFRLRIYARIKNICISKEKVLNLGLYWIWREWRCIYCRLNLMIVTIWLKLNLTINLRYHAQYLNKIISTLIVQMSYPSTNTHNLAWECMVHSFLCHFAFA